jgi:hypothetical protein
MQMHRRGLVLGGATRLLAIRSSRFFRQVGEQGSLPSLPRREAT